MHPGLRGVNEAEVKLMRSLLPEILMRIHTQLINHRDLCQTNNESGEEDFITGSEDTEKQSVAWDSDFSLFVYNKIYKWVYMLRQ